MVTADPVSTSILARHPSTHPTTDTADSTAELSITEGIQAFIFTAGGRPCPLALYFNGGCPSCTWSGRRLSFHHVRHARRWWPLSPQVQQTGPPLLAFDHFGEYRFRRSERPVVRRQVTSSKRCRTCSASSSIFQSSLGAARLPTAPATCVLSPILRSVRQLPERTGELRQRLTWLLDTVLQAVLPLEHVAFG